MKAYDCSLWLGSCSRWNFCCQSALQYKGPEKALKLQTGRKLTNTFPPSCSFKPKAYPAVPGLEGVATVFKNGPGASKFKVAQQTPPPCIRFTTSPSAAILFKQMIHHVFSLAMKMAYMLCMLASFTCCFSF